MLRLLALCLAWFAAHPAEALLLAYVALSGVNGLLPARVRTGPVGAALHVALDRISALTRSDSAGTLKWPLIVSTVIVGRPLARDVVDVSGAQLDDVRDRPTRLPPPGLGPLGMIFAVLLALSASLALPCCATMPSPPVATLDKVDGWVASACVAARAAVALARNTVVSALERDAGPPAAPDDAGAATVSADVDAGSGEAPDAGEGQ